MKKLIVLMSAIMSTNVIAATPEETGEITFLQVHRSSSDEAGQRYIVRLNGTASNNNCGTDQWTGYLTDEAGRAQYSSILAAYMASKAVRLEGNSPDSCLLNYQIIRNVYLSW